MKKQKSLTNKGFSLVELIIVVAILAILMAILAPQYLRYVERARLQKDNSTIGEFANAIKLACTDEDVAKEIASESGGVTFTFTSAGINVTLPTGGKLGDELKASFGDDYLTDIKMTSNTYSTANDGSSGGTDERPKVTVKVGSNNVFNITAIGWCDKPGATATTSSNPKKF